MVGNRRLFGEIYGGLDPDYFFRMPAESGVFLMPIIPTTMLDTRVTKPGDIDLLVLPYEANELLLHKTLAIEIKAVRASFLNQGKSPNSFGFTQANGLKEMGFPAVAVAHLIVSDESPPEAWKKVGAFQVADNEMAKQLPDREVDCMPADLMERVFYRLQSHSPAPDIGLVAAYLGSTIERLTNTGGGVWLPKCQPVRANPNLNEDFLSSVAAVFDRNAKIFLDTPRFDSN